jgi:phage shock protein A
MAAPEGNTNRATQYRIKRTLEAVLDRRSKAEGRDALEKACEALIDKAAEDIAAFRELADRLDGRPKQQTELSGPGGGPVETVTRFKLADLE